MRNPAQLLTLLAVTVLALGVAGCPVFPPPPPGVEDIQAPPPEPDVGPPVCVPTCDGGECGDDGCGDVCGTCAPGEGLCPDLVDCEVVWSKPVIAPVNTCSVACQRESIQTCNVSVDHCGPFSCKMGDRYITMVSNCSPGDGLCPPSCLIISGSDVTINLEACKLDPGSFDINFDLPIVDPGSPGMGVWRGFDPGGFN